MGQALYRKYRSKSFDEVIGQDHITKTLKNAISSGRISHAYLFTGPRGVGKTSVARILAHEVNGLKYAEDTLHLDIIEIDAASNRRIDEIRDLRDKVHIAPTSAKYKVYIIDEAHMLTREAFNALLKTLEEPPAHCIFILATTEANKLPETIVSRTQKFEFKSVGPQAVQEHLSDIAKKESIDIEPAALELLAKHGQGSFRDSISMLDQLGSSGKKITEQDIRELIGLPSADSVKNIIQAMNNGDAVKIFEELREQGADPTVMSKLLSSALLQDWADGTTNSWTTALLKDLVEVPASSQPQDKLEIAILEAASSNARTAQVEHVPKATESKPEVKAPAKKPEPKVAKSGKFSTDDWSQVLDQIKDRAPALYTAMRMATPVVSGGALTLTFQFPLHEKKVRSTTNKNLIVEVIEVISGDRLTINTDVKKTKLQDQPATEVQVPKSTYTPQAISNIFGEAEVLES